MAGLAEAPTEARERVRAEPADEQAKGARRRVGRRQTLG
jgi:hypothetical protein